MQTALADVFTSRTGARFRAKSSSFQLADNSGVDRFGQHKDVLGTIRRTRLQIAVIRQDQSSQLHDKLFPSISSMIFFTSFSSASLRRRSQAAPHQIIGYCMSTQATSTTTQALG